MQKINPCLWFDHQAEEAAKFYSSIFEHSQVGPIAHYGEAGAEVSGQKKDSVMTVEFELEGNKFLGLNAGPEFKFTPAVSLFVWCKNEKEMHGLWEKLSQGGSTLWELKKYPWAEKYGWCVDKFGVSWQLMLASNEQKITPALLFMGPLFGKGEAAIDFYLSVFGNSKIETIERDATTNSVLHARFSLDGQEFVLMEGQGPDIHTITHAISFVVNCENQQEVDYYWEKLSKGGSLEPCGWLKDPFGVSWQIVPVVMAELMSDSDPAKAERVMKAMLKMKKLNIAELKAAAQG